jgi:hypothetical protein
MGRRTRRRRLGQRPAGDGGGTCGARHPELRLAIAPAAYQRRDIIAQQGGTHRAVECRDSIHNCANHPGGTTFHPRLGRPLNRQEARSNHAVTTGQCQRDDRF